MWWKIYFWVIAVFSVIGLIGLYGQLTIWSFSDWLEVATSIVALIGLFAYIYKKDILSSQFWKIFFWIIVISWIFNIIYAFTPLEETFPLPSWLTSKAVTNETDLLIGILISSPMVYAIYKLGQKN